MQIITPSSAAVASENKPFLPFFCPGDYPPMSAYVHKFPTQEFPFPVPGQEEEIIKEYPNDGCFIHGFYSKEPITDRVFFQISLGGTNVGEFWHGICDLLPNLLYYPVNMMIPKKTAVTHLTPDGILENIRMRVLVAPTERGKTFYARITTQIPDYFFE